MAATKSFKIGERAVGGIIKVDINGKVILVKALDYYSKKEVMSGSVLSTENNAKFKLDNYLNELTSSYYADKILKWIESKVELSKRDGWY
jgi:hypothetical protein